jgi:hypothetical protein
MFSLTPILLILNHKAYLSIESKAFSNLQSTSIFGPFFPLKYLSAIVLIIKPLPNVHLPLTNPAWKVDSTSRFTSQSLILPARIPENIFPKIDNSEIPQCPGSSVHPFPLKIGKIMVVFHSDGNILLFFDLIK